MAFEGRAHVFGDDISTDLIAPGRHFHLRSNLPELAKHILEDADADFASRVRPGDLIVAGRNFGLGSSREHAPTVIKLAGVSAVLARSVARIFFRNAINVGLPVLTLDTSLIKPGDLIRVDLCQGVVIDETQDLRFTTTPLPPIMRDILSEGGLVPYVNKHKRLSLNL